MNRFQYLAVLDAFGPHVTPMAGVELAGRYWSTTSTRAAKVRALRADGRAAVLEVDHAGGDWALAAGSATVLDLRRPRDAADDPLAVGLVGLAVARLGLAHADQLAGYLADGAAVPTGWRPSSRVLVVVRPDRRWSSRDTTAARPTGARATRRRRQRIGAALLASVPDPVRHLAVAPGPCVIGLTSPDGPVALPAHWDPAGSVRVDATSLERMRAAVPGRCAVTIDASDDRRPTAKEGIMLRGDAELLARRAGVVDTGCCELAVRVERTTTWCGFDVTTQRAS